MVAVASTCRATASCRAARSSIATVSANLAMFLAEPKTTAAWGATAGFLAGFGWVALGIAIVALFERKSWKYIFINAGYMTVAFVLMGLILGTWR